MTPDEKLFDRLLSQALRLLRLSAGEKAKAVRRLDEMARRLAKQLAEEPELKSANRRKFNRILSNANKLISQTYEEIQGRLELEEVSRYVAEDTATHIKIVFGQDAINVPKPSYFKSVNSNVLIEGSPARDWWYGQEIDTQRKFAAEVRMGLLADETNQQIIRRIVGKAGEPGIMDVARRNAATLVQTSVQAVANDSRRNTYKANKKLIAAIEQVSTLDSHTTKVCIAYSGARWDLDYNPVLSASGVMSPKFNGGTPRHMNCRSLEVPVTKSWKELGVNIPEFEPDTRASANGQISAKTDFEAFLKRQGVVWQDEQLGVGRADLWRAGKITLRDLVNGDGRELTLKELRALAGLA